MDCHCNIQRGLEIFRAITSRMAPACSCTVSQVWRVCEKQAKLLLKRPPGWQIYCTTCTPVKKEPICSPSSIHKLLSHSGRGLKIYHGTLLASPPPPPFFYTLKRCCTVTRKFIAGFYLSVQMSRLEAKRRLIISCQLSSEIHTGQTCEDLWAK